ncbi:hypothetical protein SDC9_74109 [bioreactor metagenome]|uniref:Probable zinc-binding domain-containing protein n=1 Tax=bioreactor metagenome TaxID=1076179 RepID=A0A644YGG7_9ZZZZ
MVVAQDYLLKCLECGEPFFTPGEKEFYESKNLTIPTRCSKCRELRAMKISAPKSNDNLLAASTALTSDIQDIYNEILDNWSVDAKKESIRYFCHVEEADYLTSGKKSFIIGRKGCGKTAIAQYICELQSPTHFSSKLSFKNFPFKILYSLENSRDYTQPNQYISIWKYLIYSSICKSMSKNQKIDPEVKGKLEQLYGDSSLTALDKVITKWTNKSFGVEILGVGFNREREKNKENLSWIEISEILEKIILDYCDESSYYIVFDELDEDYTAFSGNQEKNDYISMLTSLFKAIQDIRSLFETNDKKIYPIGFLRSDIYSQLQYSDKNKWKESVIDLEWNTARIQKMLSHRLCVAFNLPRTEFKTIWEKLFSSKKVSMGHRQERLMDIYSYVERSTEFRPRDFIQYVKCCVELAKSKMEYPIMPQTVKDADDNFSEYLKDETIDEVFAVIPEINEILGLLSTIRKQNFRFDAFEKEYNELVKREVIPKRDVKSILLILFDAGVIGNQPTMRGKTIFRFSAKSPRFNFNEIMMVHRGLYKALQIF